MSDKPRQIRQSDFERLQEIKDEMLGLLEEAKRIIASGPRHTYERAKAYCLAHIAIALDDDHDYVGSDGANLQEIIDELDPGEPDEDDEEDEEDLHAPVVGEFEMVKDKLKSQLTKEEIDESHRTMEMLM